MKIPRKDQIKVSLLVIYFMTLCHQWYFTVGIIGRWNKLHNTIILQDYTIQDNIIKIYSGITSGRVLDGELLYTKILEFNLFAKPRRLERNLHETVCNQLQTN